MKFFFELVSCCGAPTSRSAEPPPPEETRSLVAPLPPRRSHRRRKLVRLGGSAAEGEWKPSLCAITEDNVVAAERIGERAVGSERMVKRKNESRGSVRVRSHSDDYGRTSIPAFIPAFSATPFMF